MDQTSSTSRTGSLDIMDVDNEGMEKEMVFVDNNHHKDLLSSLNLLQKNGQFCDVKLVVGKHEISAHKAVMAAVSTYFFNLFTTKDSDNMYELTDVDYESFQHLLNYAYTGRLQLPGAEVKTVYKAAMQFRIASAAKACSDFLVANLSPSNCLEIRWCAGDNDQLKTQIDAYIQKHVADVINSNKLSVLPRILIEIVGADETILGNKIDAHIFHLVFNWAKNMLAQARGSFNYLTEQTHMLYLNNNQTLQDCGFLDDSSLEEDDMIKDYKLLSKKKQLANCKNKMDASNFSPNQLRKLASGDCEWIQSEHEWSLLASYQSAERTSVGITIMNGSLSIVTLHLRPCPPHSPSSTVSDPESPTNVPSTDVSRPGSIERNVSLTLLAQMSTARCSFGLAILNKNLVAVGGYERGECLRSAEMFNIQDNVWTSLPPMKVARGRVAVAVLNNKLYACGGSDGHHELRSVECYDTETNKWSFVADMQTERSCPGVVALNNKIYCIGGCTGQRCIADCEAYDPVTNKWHSIALLNEGHFQAALCTYDGKIFAIGGSSSWNCLNSVNVYDPNTDVWQTYSCLNTPRRGAGADIIEGKIMVVGGSDGTRSLRSTEVYDKENDSWSLGPQLGMDRANVSVVTLGNKLFAVGGFSGKKFLDSLEYFNPLSEEWCCYSPVENIFQLSSNAEESNKDHNEVTDLSKKARKSHSKAQNNNIPLNNCANGII
ncbi:influenza virus NS1A-binding protein homolog A-like isoform X1 [Octopus vulgaris]|uniref:Influenza virus NS1A-binding protein homolog A-like isoform X1 n=2 Tax=Octopus TaxID=6643 RepID=A0AA36AKZ0_OCTVU|nr:influenza virus NS1A-binding protein homolog A isoform X2 [Octopus sinensis]CAI9718023.1 influenza virus NS1A-binding protein homolog A-like isoform X1 [Octopus vulgaris]